MLWHDGQIKKKADTETFSKFLIKIINSIKPDKEDEIIYQDMDNRLGLRQFLPKQRNTDNRVIPHQLYEYELKKILENAAKYLPFLNQKEDGISNTEKIISIFKFKIPYYVGPLNKHSEFAWIDRKSGKILPWNYENMIDDDASEDDDAASEDAVATTPTPNPPTTSDHTAATGKDISACLF